jgi:DNA repair protein RecO (recombination protein O)
MALIKTKGLVIKEKVYREQDKILTVFTAGEGKIQCIAKGARRKSNSLLASTQVFAYSEFVYYPGANLASLNQAHLIEAFYPLRTNVRKMALCSYLLDLINDGFDLNQSNLGMLKLLLHVLYYISKNTAKSDEALAGAFQLKLICVLGYRPILNSCSNCKTNTELRYFCIENHGLLCNRCRQTNGYKYQVTEKTILILQEFLNLPMKEIKNRAYPQEEVLKIIEILNHYIGYSIGKTSKAYSFYKELSNIKNI